MWAGALSNRQGGATYFTTFWLCVEGGLREGTMPLLASEGLLGTCPVSSHFTHFLYAAGALPAAALLVKLRVGGFEYILNLFEPFKQWKPRHFFHCHNPYCFLQPEVIGISLPGAGTLGCTVWPGAGITCSQGIPPEFYPPHMNVGLSILLRPSPLHAVLHLGASPPISATLPLLPIYMNVASLNPWLLCFHTAQFSDGSGFYLFWDLVVILSVFAQGSKVFLPTPPSWLEVLNLIS